MSPGDHSGAAVDVPEDGRLSGWCIASLDPAMPKITVTTLHNAGGRAEGRWP